MPPPITTTSHARSTPGLRSPRHLVHRPGDLDEARGLQLATGHEIVHLAIMPRDHGRAPPVGVIRRYVGPEVVGTTLVPGDADLVRRAAVRHVDHPVARLRRSL